MFALYKQDMYGYPEDKLKENIIYISKDFGLLYKEAKKYNKSAIHFLRQDLLTKQEETNLTL